MIKFFIIFLCLSNSLMIFDVIPDNITYIKVSLSSALALLYYSIYMNYLDRDQSYLKLLDKADLEKYLVFMSNKGFELKLTILILLVINIYSSTLESGYPQNVISLVSLFIPAVVLFQINSKFKKSCTKP